MKTMLNIIGWGLVMVGLYLPSLTVVGNMYASNSFGSWLLGHVMVGLLVLSGLFILISNWLWTKSYR